MDAFFRSLESHGDDFVLGGFVGKDTIAEEKHFFYSPTKSGNNDLFTGYCNCNLMGAWRRYNQSKEHKETNSFRE